MPLLGHKMGSMNIGNKSDDGSIKPSDTKDKGEESKGDKSVTSDIEEDWDKEMAGVNLVSYDPMKKVLENNFAVNTKCRSQAERRDIRTMQRTGETEGLNYLLSPSSRTSGKKKKSKSKKLPVGM